MEPIFYEAFEVCRHRKKHDADRYCAYNLLILLGPVAGRETFYEYIKIGAAVYELQPFFTIFMPQTRHEKPGHRH